MGRPERPLDPAAGPVQLFAHGLRELREAAGGPTYRELAAVTGYSLAALASATRGDRLPSLAVAVAFAQACGGDRAEWERRWREAATAVGSVAARAESADAEGAGAGDAGPPYRGLAVYRVEDAERFFGRDRLVGDLLSQLREDRFIAVVGPSGCGKSSLLRAGLAARTVHEGVSMDGRAVRVVVFTPGAHPMRALTAALAHDRSAGRQAAAPVDGTTSADMTGPTELMDATEPADATELVEAISDAPLDAADGGGGGEWVVVADQFEEVFTLCRDAGERSRFIDVLLSARRPGSRVRVVVGVRADFYGRCAEHRGLAVALRAASVLVAPMDAGELREAIVKPAAREHVVVEPGLVATIIAEVGREPGALPLVSHALLQTWRRRRGKALTLHAYQAAGGIDGAIAQTAETLYTSLPPAEQRLARDLFVRLTVLGDGTQDTKRRITRDELDTAAPAMTAGVLERLTRERLITLGRDSVEITHEALIRCWPRLYGWLTEDREGLRTHRQLTEAAHAWASLDRDPGTLYRGLRLARAQEWATRHHTALAEREREFLQAGLAAEQAERRLARRHRRRLQQAVALLSVLLMLASAATIYAVSAQRSVARQRNRALSVTVAGKAAALRSTNPLLAAQLNLAAYRLAPTSEAREGLLAAIPFPYSPQLSGHTANINSVAFSPDGHTIVTASRDKTARLWDVSDPRHPAALSTLSGHTAPINAAAFGPDGHVVATAGWDHTARLWDISDPRHPVRLSTLSTHTDDVNAVAFSPDGRTVATASTDRTAKLWNIADPRAPREHATLTGHTEAVVSVAFRPDGGMLATASFDHTIALWDPVKPRAPTLLTGHTAPVTWVAFSPDGTKLASTSQDSTTRLWNPASTSKHQLDVLTGHEFIIRSVAFSPGNRTLLTAGEDRAARLWDISGPGRHRQITSWQAHTDRAVSVAFSPDGQTIVTGSDDHTAVLWAIPATWPRRGDTAQTQTLLCQAMDTPISTTDWATYLPGTKYQPPCS